MEVSKLIIIVIDRKLIILLQLKVNNETDAEKNNLNGKI